MRLYPPPQLTRSLQGTYLADDLRKPAAADGQTYVYANFVTSLDGRIAVADARGGLIVPRETANARDWRLFQELAVQADLIISSGRYLRDYAAGKAQEILRVYDDPQFADLRDWRRDHGLTTQPAITIISNSLDFPIPPALTAGGRQVVVCTTNRADAARIRDIQAHGVPVVVADSDEVTGDWLVRAMADLGYHVIYSAAGPPGAAPAPGRRRRRPALFDLDPAPAGGRTIRQHPGGSTPRSGGGAALTQRLPRSPRRGRPGPAFSGL